MASEVPGFAGMLEMAEQWACWEGIQAGQPRCGLLTLVKAAREKGADKECFGGLGTVD